MNRRASIRALNGLAIEAVLGHVGLLRTAPSVNPKPRTCVPDHEKGISPMRSRPVIVITAIVFMPLLARAQTVTAPPRPAAAVPATVATGRFQLVPLPEGSMFLVDSVTGRVWRYTQVTPSESTIQSYVSREIAVREALSGRTFTAAERAELAERIRKEDRTRSLRVRARAADSWPVLLKQIG